MKKNKTTNGGKKRREYERERRSETLRSNTLVMSPQGFLTARGKCWGWREERNNQNKEENWGMWSHRGEGESPLEIIKEQDDSETGAIACLDWRVCFQNSILSSADDISTTIYWPVAVLPRKNLSTKKEQQNTVSLSVWQSNKAFL